MNNSLGITQAFSCLGATVACLPGRRSSSDMGWGNNREEDDRKAPEKKVLWFPKTGDITLET